MFEGVVVVMVVAGSAGVWLPGRGAWAEVFVFVFGALGEGDM